MQTLGYIIFALVAAAILAGSHLYIWRRAVRENGLDIDFYAHRQWDTNYNLPWAWIDSGTSTEHLKQEMERALVMMSASF